MKNLYSKKYVLLGVFASLFSGFVSSQMAQESMWAYEMEKLAREQKSQVSDFLAKYPVSMVREQLQAHGGDAHVSALEQQIQAVEALKSLPGAGLTNAITKLSQTLASIIEELKKDLSTTKKANLEKFLNDILVDA